MTISSTTRKAGPFNGNGVATTFVFAFKVFTKADVKLYRVDRFGNSTLLMLDSDYSVSLNINQNAAPGGTITYPIIGAPLPATYQLVALGNLPYDQPVNITNAGGFYPDVIEGMDDRSTIQIQQLAESAARAITVPETEATSPTLPNAAGRALTVLGFDESGHISMLPLPANIGAGDLRTDTFTAGVDFTAGVTSQLQLSRPYNGATNLALHFGGSYQGPENILSVVNGLMSLTAPIPFGTEIVYVTGGTTLSLNAPAFRSVTDDSISTDSKLYRRVNDVVFATDPEFGARGDGVTDDSAAIQAALVHCVAERKTLIVPAGTYRCNSRIVVTGAAQMQGEGVNKTVFLFPTNQGFLFTIPDQWHSVHLREFTIKGSLSDGTGNSAIKIFSAQEVIANAAATEISEIANVNIYGTDGPDNFNYWACCIEVEYTSNVNLLNVTLSGTNTFQGTGVWIHGDAARPPNVFNLTCVTCNYLNVGLEYGDYVQGVTLQQCNFTGDNFGVNTAPGLSILVQLAVNCSQFNCFKAGLNFATEIPDTTIVGNLIFVPGPASGVAVGIQMGRSHRYAITGNSFTAYNTAANSNGIVIGTSLSAGVISGNVFEALGFGVVLQAPSTGNNVQSNAYSGVGAPVSDSGTGNTVGGGSA